MEFFKEAWQELKKVHWPSRKETYAATLLVVIVVLMIALFLALVDFGLTRTIQAIIS
ncbi:MAG: preprotein translocase subunit SecE [Candidatus Binatota bacterium]